VTNDETLSALDDDFLWSGLTEHVHATMGIVGIAKMLKAPDDATAKEQWAGRVREVLQRLAVHVSVAPDGPARFTISDHVAVQFGIHEAVVLVDGDHRIRMMIGFDPAGTLLSTVGFARWGSRWDDDLASGVAERTIVFREGPASYAATFPWVAQNPGGLAPWTCAATAEEARRAGLVEDLGFAGVAALFQKLQKEAS
jgi:hypothetical protein